MSAIPPHPKTTHLYPKASGGRHKTAATLRKSGFTPIMNNETDYQLERARRAYAVCCKSIPSVTVHRRSACFNRIIAGKVIIDTLRGELARSSAAPPGAVVRQAHPSCFADTIA
jgi:hypothetical protein